MKIRGAQWNIQAGRVRALDADPLEGASYKGDRPDYFANVLSHLKVDFVTLQEVHANDSRNQAQEIADLLNFNYVRTDVLEERSFMDANFSFAQAILTNLPVVYSEYIPIPYVPYDVNDKNDQSKSYVSRPNGYTRVDVKSGNDTVTLLTAHMLPFGVFQVDPFGELAIEVRSAANAGIPNVKKWILQLDSNVETERISSFLHSTALTPGYEEVVRCEPTWPRGSAVDHIASRNIKILTSDVHKDVLADHFLLVTEYEL